MKQNTAIIGLHARTSIAAGTGQNLGSIDLPIMREAPTEYPVVFGSALKGAMRMKFENEIDKNAAKIYFGDDSEGGSQYAGAVIISDAKLLLLPVRSMNTHFKWVTCPYILKRYFNDKDMLGDKTGVKIPTPDMTQAITAQSNGDIYLEEFKFEAISEDISALIDEIDKIMDGDNKESLQKQLVIISDDMFHHISKFATPVNAHIAIDNATKIVKNGALWYEETLPPETLLYSMFIANASRKEGDTNTQAQIIKENIIKHLKKNDYLQIGGNETVGMGWCKVVCDA